MTIDLKFYFVLMSFILLEILLTTGSQFAFISGGKHQLKEGRFRRKRDIS
jgi:hypothetical protein